MQSWFVYLIRCADNTLYCGITTDIERRLKQHNEGSASKYTRSRRPVTLAAHGFAGSKSDALKLEIKIKKQPTRNKIDYLRHSTTIEP